MTNFDPDRGVSFQGKFDFVNVIDLTAPPGHQRNLVIDPQKKFAIEIQWTLTGGDVGLYLGHEATEESWRINIFAECMGPGEDKVLYEGKEPKGEAEDPKIYAHTCEIPPGKLPENIPDTQSGVYKLVATVFLNNTSNMGYDIAGFYEGPMIMIECPE
jgi:hypothetical protein